MEKSILISENFNNQHIFYVRKENFEKSVIKIKKINYIKAFFDFISFGYISKDPEEASLFQIIKSALKIHEFAVLSIRKTVLEELKRIEDIDNPQLKSNIVFLNQKIIKGSYEDLQLPKKEVKVLSLPSLTPPNAKPSITSPKKSSRAEDSSDIQVKNFPAEGEKNCHRKTIGIVAGIFVTIVLGTLACVRNRTILPEKNHIDISFDQNMTFIDDTPIMPFSRHSPLIHQTVGHYEAAFKTNENDGIYEDEIPASRNQTVQKKNMMSSSFSESPFLTNENDGIYEDEIPASRNQTLEENRETAFKTNHFFWGTLIITFATSVFATFSCLICNKKERKESNDCLDPLPFSPLSLPPPSKPPIEAIIRATKSQFTNKKETVASCCSIAMQFLEMLFQRSPDQRLNISPNDLDQVLKKGDEIHTQALAKQKEGMKEIALIEGQQHIKEQNEIDQMQIEQDMNLLQKQMQWSSGRLSPVDVIPFFAKTFESNSEIKFFNNTYLSENIDKRTAHFEKVYSDLEHHLKRFGGVVGATITCNKQTYSMFVVEDREGQKHYGVFDSHGAQKKLPVAFAFRSTSKREAAKKCEELSGFVKFEPDKHLKEMCEENALQSGYAKGSLEFKQFVLNAMQKMCDIPKDQNRVSHYYLFPKKIIEYKQPQ